MKRFLFALLALALLIPLAGAQSYHNPVYLVGGYGTTSTYTYYPTAIFLYDKTGAAPTISKLCDLPTPTYTMRYPSLYMDYDNKNLLMCSSGTSTAGYAWSNSLLHYDVAAKTWTSLWNGQRVSEHAGPGSYKYSYPYSYANPFVDQNGDTLFGVYGYEYVTSPSTLASNYYAIFKYDRTTASVRTIVDTVQAGFIEYWEQIDRDIDSGKILVAGGRSQTSPNTMRYAVHTFNPEDGYNPANHGFWNDGSVYGWYNYSRGVEQNLKNGYLERPYYTGLYVYQLQPGSGGYTTISTVPNTGFPNTTVYGYSGKYDLQTAAKPRYLLNTYYSSTGAWLMEYDVNTWSFTGFDLLMNKTTHPEYNYFYNYNFEFYQGRHLQTVRDLKTPNKWDILISIPHLPKMPYVLAAGASGVRPGMALPDGRTINLCLDPVVWMTASNLVPGIWNIGPGMLDGNGEAKGSLDLSKFKIPSTGIGQPIWIAVAVLDPKAPCGIAYLPDTYVMRL
ncbi:MAG: hypothetical protein JXQ29_00205 [Planctomycetes bacterium]|nr:hypothetical protein [Planctomycetota bacterium]